MHQELASWVVSEKFRRLLLGYAKAINKQEKRNGSLFQKIFRRKKVDGEESCKGVAAYIHRNGVHHKYSDKIENYPWSSYGSCLSEQPTLLRRDKVLDWFGGKQEYVKYHKNYVEEWKDLQRFLIEE